MERSIGSLNMDLEAMKCISVVDFYAGKSVFITGGTGFLGKVIIEKLLYSCPRLDKVYVLVREQSNKNIHQRIQELFDMPLFDRLKQENPQQLTKIVPIAGDITQPNLGMKEKDMTLLLNQVNVVIHSAANIKFNEKLKVALRVNYDGTKNVLDLSQQMKNIIVFVHVSSAYTNTFDDVIEEKVYPFPMKVDNLHKMLDERSGKDESELLCGKPNSYTLTKALSESFVLENHGNIPTVIIKPSIITPSISEPVKGWVENWFGATAYLTGVSRGFCRAIISRRDIILDIIPVDYVSNLINIAAAKCHTCNDVQVFNSCSSSTNPVTMGQLTDMYTELAVNNKCNDLPFPKVLMTQSRWVYWIVILFTELIPAYIAEICIIQFGNPPRFIKMQAQISKFRNHWEYFMNRSWLVQNSKARALATSLSAEEAILFPCDSSAISWPKYVTTYFGGVKRFLFDGKQRNNKQVKVDCQQKSLF